MKGRRRAQEAKSSLVKINVNLGAEPKNYDFAMLINLQLLAALVLCRYF